MNALDFRKRAIMSVINNVKGFERSASGTSVTLEGCVDDDSIIDYKIYGNCYQDGEPSIENPIEVQCVGDRTKNLFDISSTRGFQSIYGALTNTVKNDELIVSTTAAARSCRMELGIFKAGTYTISFKCVNLNCGWGIETGDDLSSLTDIGLFPSATKQNLTFTLSETNKIWLKLHSIFNTIPSYTFSNIQLEEGDTATDYEPYGYKIPITTSGKNLFDVANKDGWLTSAYSYYPIYVGANKTVAVSWDNDLSDGQGFYLCIGSTQNEKGNGNVKSINWLYHLGSTLSLRRQSISVTADEEGFIYINMAPLSLSKLTKLQVEYGDTVTDYEPYYEPITTNIYLDEPLRGIDSYLDCADYKNKVVVRDVAKNNSVFTGALEWLYRKQSKVVKFHSNAGGVEKTKIFSHILPWVSDWLYGSEHIMNHMSIIGHSYWGIKWERLGLTFDGTKWYKTDDETQTALTDEDIILAWKAYRDTTFSSEDLVTYLVRSTPIETPITLPKLPTFKGTTIYTVETSLQPSKIEVNYYSNVKGE